MANLISANELQPCDVLLYHENSIIAKLIRYFDGSEYNHASIYYDGHVLEAIAKGVRRNSLNDSIKDAVFVDVYRYISDNAANNSAPQMRHEAILNKMIDFENESSRYGFEQLILLSLLCSVRKESHPMLGPVIRIFLDQATEVISDIIAAGKEPMICSELVYRCFAEAEPVGRYQLKITGISDSLLNELTSGTSSGFFDSDNKTSKEIMEFLKFYNISKIGRLLIPALEGSSTHSTVVADFVTPRDLKQSSNLYKVGTLRI